MNFSFILFLLNLINFINYEEIINYYKEAVKYNELKKDFYKLLNYY